MILSFFGLKASGLKRSHIFFILLARFFRRSFKALQRFLISFLLIIFLSVLCLNYRSTHIQDSQRWLSDVTFIGLSSLQAPFTTVYQYFQSHRLLREKIQDLSLENQNLRFLQTRVLSYEQENIQLRKLLNVLPLLDKEFVTVPSLGKQNDNFNCSLVLELNPFLKLRKNQVVLGPEGIIGRISKINFKTAKVLLITDTRSRIPAKIKSTGEQVILMGDEGGLELKVLHRARTISESSSPPKVGDLLLTSGKGGVYPPNFPIARIIHIEDQSIKAKALADADSCEYVIVLKEVITSDYDDSSS